MLWTQEQEHWDYEMGAQSEWQNCYAEARMVLGDHNRATLREVDRFLGLGYEVVLAHYPWHCRATDAIVGQGVSIAHVAPSREAAQTYLEKYDDPYGESDTYLELIS